MVYLDEHIDSFVVEGCLKFDLSVTPNDPKMTPPQIPEHLKEPLAKDLFTQVSSKSIELCTWKALKGAISDSLGLRKIFKPFRNKEKYLFIKTCTTFPQQNRIKNGFL